MGMTIKQKIIASIVLVVLLVFGIGGTAVISLMWVNSDAAEVRDVWLPGCDKLGVLLSYVEDYRVGEGDLLTAQTSSDLKKREEALNAAAASVARLRQEYDPYIVKGGKAEELSQLFDQQWKAYQDVSRKFIQAQLVGNSIFAQSLFTGKDADTFNKSLETVKALLKFSVEQGKASANRGEAIYKTARIVIFAAIAAALVVAGILGVSLIRGVALPILGLTGAMRRLASHDMTTEIPGAGRADEIGAMADAVEVFKSGLIEADRLTTERQRAMETREKRAQHLEELNREFDRVVRSALDNLGTAAQDLRGTAEGLSGDADMAAGQVANVAAAADQASSNVETVAAATEELSASVQEILRQITMSTQIAGKAVDQAASTASTIRSLAEAASRIGSVVAIINDIASQTNLLALNATIEAARAGEAGKGFAVVAGEVKTLANQTGKATEEIAAQVSEMQSVVDSAVKAIEGINATIGQMSEISTAISAAMEEQGAATQEITRNVQEAARGTIEVTNNIGGVSNALDHAKQSSDKVLGASGYLGSQAQSLRDEVARYLSSVASA